ncbi:hypothetical protein ACFYTS_05640 [Nocardia sp. NPDC004151]|uniref:hypothetical protein n=1 Tax=Nocardia sp. NPDC004151 TaxID=3364304 RepID=UPI0036A8F9B8
MATDRPGGPDNPDRPTPDPAHPSEPPSPPSESATSGNPAEPTPDTSTPPRSDRNAPTIRARPADPTLPMPGGPRGDQDTTTDEPAATSDSPGESGSEPSGPTPTLRFPAGDPGGGSHPTPPLSGASATPPDAGGPHPTHPLAGESHGGAGTFGSPGAAPLGAVAPPPGVEPPFTLPMPSLEPDAPPVPAAPQPPRRGSIISQEAGITQPRPPTVAEVRAREKARKRAEEQQQAEAEAAEAKQRKKKRVLIGGAAVAGIAALVGGGYLVASAWSGPDVTASCTVVADKGEIVPIGNGQTVTADRDNQEIVVPDNYCSSATSGGHPGTHTSTFIYLGHSYRYYYGGNTTIGRAPTGGTTVAPKGATVKTKSGSTIQRGGLGAKIGGGS